MGLLNNALRGVAVAGMASLVAKVVNQNGGVQGLMQRFQQGGLGNVFDSWVGTGQNQPVSGQQVHQALGQDQINQLAQQMGVPPQQLADHLAELLPHTVDRMTPDGQVPQVHQNATDDDIRRMLEQA